MLELAFGLEELLFLLQPDLVSVRCRELQLGERFDLTNIPLKIRIRKALQVSSCLISSTFICLLTLIRSPKIRRDQIGNIGCRVLACDGKEVIGGGATASIAGCVKIGRASCR